MQRRVKTDPDFVRDNLGIRIGLHHGDALIDANDVFGDAVNTPPRAWPTRRSRSATRS